LLCFICPLPLSMHPVSVVEAGIDWKGNVRRWNAIIGQFATHSGNNWSIKTDFDNVKPKKDEKKGKRGGRGGRRARVRK
jgi:hypothetical protein